MFLSYASADRAVAQRLAHAIEQAGLSVWWDRHIKGGAEFSRDIEQQLDAADHVLVLWSKESVNSRWVRDEASVAADTRRLVAASMDGTPPPLGFRQFQTIDLQAWAARGAALPPELADALDVDRSGPTAPQPPTPKRKPLVTAGIGALLLAGAATLAIVQPAPLDRWLSGEKQDNGVSLAIMPFVVDGAAGDSYLGPGLARALADSLAPLSGLKLTASTSTQAIAGKGLTAPEIGAKLGITHLVEGNVQRNGTRYAVAVRLIEADKSEQVWARSFDGPIAELQDIKSRMARELAGAIRARLGVGQGDVANRGKVDPMAYEAYLRALERISVRDNREARRDALKQFRLAASIDPDFADAHAGYAYVMALSSPGNTGMTWAQLMAEQRRATARALQLDPNNDLALTAKSVALNNFEGDPAKALPIAEAVLKRSPNFAPAHYSMAANLWLLGRGQEALGHLDQAIARDPFETITRFYRIQLLYSLGDYEAVRDAVRECEAPCLASGWFWLLAMAGFATPAQVRQDIALLEERSKAGGVSPADLAEGRRIVEAFVLSRPFTPTPLETETNAEFADAAIFARLASFEQGLRYAQSAADRKQPDSVLDILNEGRVTFTPEQRADPRYHALFRNPKLVKIAAARRAAGVTAGLPVFPVKPYSGR